MRVLARTRGNQLVEFQDGTELRRVWMPGSLELTLENARRGADVGPTADDIEALGLHVDPAKLLYALHRRGIWTVDDVRRAGGSSKVNSALKEGLGWATAQLINLFVENRR